MKLLPYYFYAVGSLCFLIGTLLVIRQEVTKEPEPICYYSDAGSCAVPFNGG